MSNDESTSVGIPVLCAQAVAFGQGGGGCQFRIAVLAFFTGILMVL